MKVNEATILDNYRAWLRKIASQLIADPHLQQDLAQEGWVAMWRAFQDYDESKGALPSWLTTKALWRMRDCARDRAWLGRPPRHMGRSNVRDAVEYASSDTPMWELLEAVDVVDAVCLAYHRGEIMTAIAALSPAQRRYVYLRFWKGYQKPELVQAFGYEPHALWHRAPTGAKHKLRVALERLSVVA